MDIKQLYVKVLEEVFKKIILYIVDRMNESIRQ